MGISADEKAKAANTALTLILDQHISLPDEKFLERQIADKEAEQQVIRARQQLDKQRTQLDAAANEIGIALLDLDTRLAQAALKKK
jgi:hypothetical protein